VVRPVPVLPSPNVHVKVIESPSGSEEPAALKVTGLSVLIFSDGFMDICAVGGSLPDKASRHPANGEHTSRIAISGVSVRMLAIVEV